MVNDKHSLYITDDIFQLQQTEKPVCFTRDQDTCIIIIAKQSQINFVKDTECLDRNLGSRSTQKYDCSY